MKLMYIVSCNFIFHKEEENSRQNGRVESTSLRNSHIKLGLKLLHENRPKDGKHQRFLESSRMGEAGEFNGSIELSAITFFAI